MTVNIPWRMGANMRSLAYYGEPGTIMENVESKLKRTQIEEMKNHGIQTVRFYAPHHRVSTERSLDLIDETMDMLGENNMQAVICLGDALSLSGHFFLNDGSYHTESHGQLNRRYWVDQQYVQTYIPFIKAVVDRFKNHKAVLIWEIGNEHAIHPQDGTPDAAEASKKYLEFVRTATDIIRQIDDNAIVGTGLVNTRHAFWTEDRAQLKAFSQELHSIVDAVSVHVYEQDDHENARLELDAEVAREMGKLLYVGEVGSNFHSKRQPRPNYYRDRINFWRKQGAFMVMPWDFNSTTIAIADDLGVSNHFPDYNQLVQVIAENKGDMSLFNRPVRATVATAMAASAKPAAPVSEGETVQFKVQVQLSVRDAPSLSANRVSESGEDVYLMPDAIVDFDATSRTEADGHVWWRHDKGWSAERTLDADKVYLVKYVVV